MQNDAMQNGLYHHFRAVCCLYHQYSPCQHHVPQHLHLHQHCCHILHCHSSQTSCLPSTILISLTPFSTKVLAAARPAMPAPTIITWQQFVRSSTGTLAKWQLQQFRYKCNVRHLLSYRHRAQETYTVTGIKVS